MSAVAALALSSVANAETDRGPKVDASVNKVADAPSSTADTEINVLIFGTDLAAANTAAGIQPKHSLQVVGGQSARIRVRDLAALTAHKGVSFISLDRPVVPTGETSTTNPLALAFPGLASIYPQLDGAVGRWSTGYTGAGVGIAVIDSGIADAADFGARVVRVKLPGQSEAPADTIGHGTFVAGVAAGASTTGQYVGIAPRATLYAINVARPTGGVYTSDVIEAIDWVLAHHKEHNIRVVNLSFSQVSPSSYLTSALDAAVERLWRAGVVVVASAGNLGEDSAVYAPANDPFIITVGALDPNDTLAADDDQLAEWSSRGTTYDGHTKPELLAPGRHIVSTLPAGTSIANSAPLANLVAPGYAMMNGTSFSAPQVSGAVAVLLQQHPEWTPDQVKSVLVRTARRVPESSAGAIDLAAAAVFVGTP